MALSPIPHVVKSSGAAGSAPEGAIPIDLYGASSDAPTFSELAGTVSGVTGANLQAILEDLATRLAAVETP